MAFDSSFAFADWIFLIKLLTLFLSLTFFMGENIDAVKDKAVWKLCEFMYMNHVTEIDSPWVTLLEFFSVHTLYSKQ